MDRSTTLPRDELLGLFKTMVLIREFDSRVRELFYANRIPGFIHVCVGQEAVAAGACKGLREGDYIAPTHRGHGHCIAKGADPKLMMAELFGKRNGYCKGKGGSMHMSDFSHHILGANGIVGGCFPIATGVALALKQKKRDDVVLCFFGDGAANQGTFHEAVNIATIWDLPIVYLCENNELAETTYYKSVINVKNIADRAAAYGIKGKVVDGNDVLAVYNEVKEAVENVRGGSKPILLECKTLRWMGHYEGDPEQMYRTKEDKEEIYKKDPIKRFESWLMERKLLDEKESKKVRDDVTSRIDEAVSFAEQSPWPEPKEAFTDIFVES